MRGKLSDWFRRNAYGQFTRTFLLALGSAAVSVGLSFLPHDAVLQAIWVLLASLYIGFRNFNQRLNESDEIRYRRIYQGRFAHLEKTNPEALNTIFADNLRPPVLDWFATDHGLELKKVPRIDALDSLSRSGDVPGQLIFRTGVQLGQWLGEARRQPDPLQYLDQQMGTFVDANESLLGQQLQPGLYLRYIRPGEPRPVGVHLFHPASRGLFTIESGVGSKRGVALSFKSTVFDGWSEDQWNQFKQGLYREFPWFKPAKGGSGPQKRSVPLFVASWMELSKQEERTIPERLQRVMALLPAPTVPAQARMPGHVEE